MKIVSFFCCFCYKIAVFVHLDQKKKKFKQKDSLIKHSGASDLVDSHFGYSKININLLIHDAQVARLVTNQHNFPLSRFVLIDCRFPYEYEGGHVRGAINVYTEEQMDEIFTRHLPAKDPGLCLIFYCEFSSYRSPKLYTFFF